MPNPELLARIVADDERDESFLVYADWLQSQGDPRGELIVLQRAMRLSEDPAEFLPFRAREKELLEAHPQHFLGPFADAPETCRITWRNGFFGALAYPAHSAPIDTPAEIVVAALDHPSARLLRSLQLHGTALRRDFDVQAVIDDIRRRRGPQTLRVLTIDGGSAIDVRGIGTILPHLRKLTVRGQAEFGVEHFPHLHSLTLYIGGDDFQRYVGLLSLGDLSSIRNLSITGSGDPDAVVRFILGFPDLLDRLETLEVDGPVSHRVARQLLAARPGLTHLGRLKLDLPLPPNLDMSEYDAFREMLTPPATD